MDIVLLFIIGSVLGSFLNVVIDRFATGRSITKGRSYCENCKETLRWIDLIPIWSYLILRGKCRSCHAVIPVRLLVVEVLSAVLTVYIYMLTIQFGVLPTVLLMAITYIFIAIFFIDLQYGIIPDKLTIPLTILTAVFIVGMGFDLLNFLFAGLVSLGFFFGLFVITKGRGMGFGDVKLSFTLGLLLGFPLIVFGLYIAFLTGAAVSIILILWKRKPLRKTTIPFGPFLVFGTLFAYFFSESVIYPLVQYLF